MSCSPAGVKLPREFVTEHGKLVLSHIVLGERLFGSLDNWKGFLLLIKDQIPFRDSMKSLDFFSVYESQDYFSLTRRSNEIPLGFETGKTIHRPNYQLTSELLSFVLAILPPEKQQNEHSNLDNPKPIVDAFSSLSDDILRRATESIVLSKIQLYYLVVSRSLQNSLKQHPSNKVEIEQEVDILHKISDSLTPKIEAQAKIIRANLKPKPQIKCAMCSISLENKEMFECPLCDSVVYCSSEHATEDWEKSHGDIHQEKWV
jgi:hypothetical protein